MSEDRQLNVCAVRPDRRLPAAEAPNVLSSKSATVDPDDYPEAASSGNFSNIRRV